MSRYRKVDPRIWNDAKFRGLSDNAKLVFFYLLTHPHMTAVGAMRANIPGMAADIGWEDKDFRKAFQECLQQGMAEHDETACFVSLPKFIRYNRPENPNVLKSWLSAMDLLPECDLKETVYQRLKDFAKGASEGFAKAFSESFGNTFAESGAGTVAGDIPVGSVPLKKRIFDLGIDVLCGAGVKDKNARALIGKLRKAKGDDDALRVLMAAQDKTHPEAYINAAMKDDASDPTRYAI